MPAAKPSTPSRLTPKLIEGFRPAAKAYRIPDRGCRGLVLRVTPAGSKVFRWEVRSLGRAITIGPWSMEAQPGHVTHAEAREWFHKLTAARRGGNLAAIEADLREHLGRQRPGQSIARADGKTIADVIEEFSRVVIAKRKRPEEARDLLDRHLMIDGFKDRPIADVRAPEVGEIVKRYVAAGAPARAGKLLALIKQAWGFAEGNGYTERNPARVLKPDALGIVAGQRTRCLDDPHLPNRGEIRMLWNALEAEPAPVKVERPDPRTGKVQVYEQRTPTLAVATRTALKILLLTGVRTGELLKARWEEVDLDGGTWVIPVKNQKLTRKQEATAFPWSVPLAPEVVDLFNILKAEAGTSPWVMASQEADAGHYDDRSLGHAARRLQGGTRGLKLPGGPFAPHDLRRTMRTHLSKLRVQRDVRERCLNHRLGKIEDTYDRHDFLEERREALEKWAAYVEREVTGAGAQIVPLAAMGA